MGRTQPKGVSDRVATARRFGRLGRSFVWVDERVQGHRRRRRRIEQQPRRKAKNEIREEDRKRGRGILPAAAFLSHFRLSKVKYSCVVAMENDLTC